MSKQSIEEFEIELWKRALNEADAEVERLDKDYKNDPTTVLLDVHFKFNALLEKHQGKERLTPQFKAEIDKLARIEKRAKLRAKTYDIGKAGDLYFEAKFHRDQVLTKLNTLEYTMKWRKEKSSKNKHMCVKCDTSHDSMMGASLCCKEHP